jgi:hypothetical protein
VLAEGKAAEGLSSETVIQNYYANKKDFTTLYLKADARYEDKDNTQNVTAEIKIKKDEKILGQHTVSRNHDGKNADHAQ